MFKRLASKTARSAVDLSRASFTRSFCGSKILCASENPAAERAARLAAFLQTIRSNENVYNQLKSVQLIIASKVQNTNETPSLMDQLKLLSDAEVRAEMTKLSEVMKQENVNISREDVGWLMQAFKAQMDEGK